MTTHKKFRPWIIAGSLLSLLALFLFVLLPLGIRYSLSKWLLEKGADTAVIDRVRINPFLGTMSLEGVTVKIGENTVLSDSDIQVDIGMLALLKKEAVLEKSTLVGVTLDLELYDDGRLRIGSYTTPLEKQNKPTENKAGAAWLFAANRVDMQDCTIHFKMKNLDLTLHIDEANLVKFTTAPGDKSGRLFLRGTVNKTPVVLDLDTLRILPDIVTRGTVKVEGFALDNLAALLKPTVAPFTGTAFIDGKAGLTMNNLGDITVDYDGMLAVEHGDIGGASYRVKAVPVRWPQGTIHFAMTEERGIEVDVNGRLTGKKVEVILPDPALHVRGPDVDIQGQVQVTVARQVLVNARASLVLDNPSLKMDGLNIEAKKLAWQGKSPSILFNTASQTDPLSVTARGTFLASDYTVALQPSGNSGRPVTTSGRELIYTGSANVTNSGPKSASTTVQTDGVLTGQEIALTLDTLLEMRQQKIKHDGKVAVSLKGNKGIRLTLDDTLSGDKLFLHLPEKDLRVDQEHFFTTHKGTVAIADKLSVRGTTSGEANGFTLKTAKKNKPLFSIAKLKIKTAKAPTDNHVSIETISGDQLVHHLAGAMPMAISVPKVTISGLRTKNLTDWSIDAMTAQQPVAVSSRSKERLAGLGSLEVRSIGVDNNLRIKVDRILFDDLFFLKPAQKKGQSICTIGSARLSKIGWQADNGLQGSSLSLADLYCTLIRNKDGSLVLAKHLAAMRDPAAGKKKKTKKKKNGEATVPIRLDQITLRGTSGLHFEDHTLAIPFISNLDLTTFQVTDLDSRQPNKPARLRLKGTLEKRAPLSINGTIKPFADPLALHLKLLLKNYPLNHLSAYTVQSVGVALASGSLRINSDIKLANNRLDMHNTIILKQLKTSTISKELADKLDNRLPIPLESALSMLKDRDDTIKLDVPISGPLDKLNVGISDILITALGKAIVPAASGYLVYALGPYGALAWVGMELGSRMLAVKLPPVFFAPGETTLPDTVDDYFSRLAKILQDKPEADFRLCPKVSAWELMKKEKDKEKKSAELTPEMEKQLRELGQERAAAIKAYLVEKFGVDESRLLICTTEIDKKKSAKPRVEIRM